MSEEARASYTENVEKPDRNLRIAVFLLGIFSMFLLTYYVGTYFLFFAIPLMLVRGHRNLAVTFFDGALAGAFLGLIFLHIH